MEDYMLSISNAELRTPLFFAQFDKEVVRLEISTGFYKNTVRISRVSGKYQSSGRIESGLTEEEEFEVPRADLKEEIYWSYVDFYLKNGWDTDVDVVWQDRPVFRFNKKPITERLNKIKFSRAGFFSQESDESLITRWNIEKGEMRLLITTDEGECLCVGVDGSLKEIPSMLSKEFSAAYPPESCVKGVWDGKVFYQWEMIALEGKDVCSQKSFVERLPKHSGKHLRYHVQLNPWDAETRTHLVTHNEMNPEGTVYTGYKDVAVLGVWVERPIRRS